MAKVCGVSMIITICAKYDILLWILNERVAVALTLETDQPGADICMHTLDAQKWEIWIWTESSALPNCTFAFTITLDQQTSPWGIEKILELKALSPDLFTDA